LPCKTDLARDKDFWAALSAFFFQTLLRVFFFAFDVRFLGTAIKFYRYYFKYKLQSTTNSIKNQIMKSNLIFYWISFNDKIKEDVNVLSR